MTIVSQVRRKVGRGNMKLNDIDLVVGGICQLEYSNKGWQKFSCVVPANSKKSIGGLFIGSINKYKIHFVERGD